MAEPKHIDRQRFIDDVKSFVGTPYHHQGRDENGLDCAGLLIAALRRQGFNPPAPSGYGKNSLGISLLEHIDRCGLFHKVTAEQRQPGDVLVFAIRREPQHLALLAERPPVGPELMLHSADVIMQVRWVTLGESWLRRLAAVYRTKS
ncbi:MAG: C40 family peptidase [Candidatus Adiutrix sp.]|jgi:cell wall-associated NlpC family hydrolase|nr:C40 family peptidase [Candidatus Adiutrix sp.]